MFHTAPIFHMCFTYISHAFQAHFTRLLLVVQLITHNGLGCLEFILNNFIKPHFITFHKTISTFNWLNRLRFLLNIFSKPFNKNSITFHKAISSRCGEQEAIIAMNGLVRILSVAVLVAGVSGQICVDETLDCNQPVPTIFKLGDQSCPCNSAAHAGALKYAYGKVHVCLGTTWKTIQFVEDLNAYAARKITLDIPVKISWTMQDSN